MKDITIYEKPSGKIVSSYKTPDRFAPAKGQIEDSDLYVIHAASDPDLHCVKGNKVVALEIDHDAIAGRQARAQRNHLLMASDWTQLSDVPSATKAAWVKYRKALRDIPNQAGFPHDITWPEVPE